MRADTRVQANIAGKVRSYRGWSENRTSGGQFGLPQPVAFLPLRLPTDWSNEMVDVRQHHRQDEGVLSGEERAV